jgi:starch-binding outer membrane protein, SusD/RagB family
MKFNKAFLYLLLLLAATSCKKYVDVSNPDALTDPDYWRNETSVRTYNWEFYNMFPGFGNGSGTNGDFYFTTFTDDQCPVNPPQYQITTPTTNADWSFTYVRKANIMLERIDGIASMNDEAKNHWKGIARFFRALQYFRLVQNFGDVPWYGHSVEAEDSTQLYKPRDPRKMVMDSVLEDLNYAVANIRLSDGDNTVNKDVARALKSRVCLYEGTYRKYHTELQLSDAGKWLTEAKNAAQELLTRPYSLNSNYQTIYNSNDLYKNPEILLYKRYETGILSHATIGYLYSSTVISGLNKSAVESYLCSDGKPISISPLYKGDATFDDFLANRDKRLRLSIDTTYLYYTGHMKNSLRSSTGYRVVKFLPDTNAMKTIPVSAGTNVTDAPIFYLSEVYLNYAEAAAELSDMGLYIIEQSDLDNTINKLRARAGVAKLLKDPGFTDPKMDADIPTALIWEIRRERRAELMMDGFRYQDLMRWKKGMYLDSKENPDTWLGARIPVSSITNPSGYIMPYPAASQRVFTDPKHYLSWVPTKEILLYPTDIQKTMQNPGW